MSRELRRVPLNFYWPLNKVWRGYRNPHVEGHQKQCEACGGSGYSPLARILKDQWYGFTYFHPSFTGNTPFYYRHPHIQAFSARQCEMNPGYYGTGKDAIDRNAKRLTELWNGAWCHHLDEDDVVVLLEEGRLSDFKRAGIEKPTPYQVNVWSLGGFGHDSINCWLCLKAKMKRLGERTDCDLCRGKGECWDSKENRKRAERWKERQPPAGPGFQVWETVSEGSPISPVFQNPDGVERWLVKQGYTPTAAKEFIKVQWVASMFILGGKVYQDIEIFGEKASTPAPAAPTGGGAR